MILFFRTPSKSVIATEIDHKPSQDEINELCWLSKSFRNSVPIKLPVAGFRRKCPSGVTIRPDFQ